MGVIKCVWKGMGVIHCGVEWNGCNRMWCGKKWVY
jgi:hypothetical protein